MHCSGSLWASNQKKEYRRIRSLGRKQLVHITIQETQPIRMFNTELRQILKKIRWTSLPGQPSLNWVPQKLFSESECGRYNTDNITKCWLVYTNVVASTICLRHGKSPLLFLLQKNSLCFMEAKVIMGVLDRMK